MCDFVHATDGCVILHKLHTDGCVISHKLHTDGCVISHKLRTDGCVILSTPSDFDDYADLVQKEKQSHFGALVIVAFGCMIMSAFPTVLTFPYERPVFIREYV